MAVSASSFCSAIAPSERGATASRPRSTSGSSTRCGRSRGASSDRRARRSIASARASSREAAGPVQFRALLEGAPPDIDRSVGTGRGRVRRGPAVGDARGDGTILFSSISLLATPQRPSEPRRPYANRAANVRTPDMTLGDVWAQVASCRLGAIRFQEICRKHGVATVRHYGTRREVTDRGAVPHRGTAPGP